MKITIPCKRKDCPGYVTYVEQDVAGAVKMVVPGFIAVRRTKRVSLECSNLDDPHEYLYEIDAAIEDTSNHVLGYIPAMKDSDAG